MAEKITQTAGRDQLGSFSPMFAHLNDDVLFGEVWNETAIDVKQKCIITVVALMASGVTDSSLMYHLQNAKNRGVTREEIAAIITHATMYVGWPKGWAVFRMAAEVWKEERKAAFSAIDSETPLRIRAFDKDGRAIAAAPCQCLTSGGMFTTVPGSSFTGSFPHS